MNEIQSLAAGQAGMANAIDSVWVAICAALIFQMEGGFALLEAGFIRGKNAMSIIAVSYTHLDVYKRQLLYSFQSKWHFRTRRKKSNSRSGSEIIN